MSHLQQQAQNLETQRLFTDHKTPVLPVFYNIIPIVCPGWQANIEHCAETTRDH